jgi:hypothetical protein
MRPSRSTAARAHGDWRSPRAEAARQRDEAEVSANVVGPALSALRRGREAVVEIDGQLDEALAWVADLADPTDPKQSTANVPKPPPRDLADRMAASARRAGEALTGLGTLLYDDGPAGSELF